MNQMKKINTSKEWEITFDSISDPISIHDKDFNLVMVNQAFSDLVKQDRHNLVGKKCFEVMHDTRNPITECPHIKTLENKEPFTEEVFESNLEKYLEISTSPILDGKGHIYGTVHIVKDITERKHAEFLLKESENKFRLFYENAPLGYQSLDKDGNILTVNKAWLDLLGYSKKEVIGKNINEFIIQKRNFKDKFNKFKKLGVAKEVKFEFIKKDKSRVNILIDGRITNDIQGNFVQTHCILHDITVSKNNEEKLQRDNNELELRVNERTLELERANEKLLNEVIERRQLSKDLMEKNNALKVLIKQWEDNKNEVGQNIISNIKSLILPYIIILKSKVQSDELAYLNIIESNLNDIVSPFSNKLSSSYLNLSPKELQIAQLIRDGMQDKDIADTLFLSLDTIKTHRKHIRKKLGICGRKINLRSKLLSMNTAV